MVFDPKTNKFPYTTDTASHYLKVKKNDGTVFNKDYPYIDNSKKFLRTQSFFRVIVKLIAFPLTRIRMNLKVEGKENLKKYKDVINNGIISVCNHVHMWDYLTILAAIKKYRPHILAWGPNISGENGFLIRMVGGVPIPTDDFIAMNACYSQIIEDIKKGGWFHLYPEGSMWEFYQPIRPFKMGAAYFSLKSGKPILPFAYSYRKNGFIRSKIFKSPASFTLHIGEPIYPDLNLPFKEAEEKLTKEIHDRVCTLAGIDPKENIYEPIYNNSTRIDYYTTEYGVGYKGSW